MGRAKEFCVELALTKALEVFWRRGFQGASLTELTEAMGITRPSLYATYGNKEELFRKALDLYDDRYMGFSREALNEATSFEVVSRILMGFVDMSTDREHPLGCLGTNGSLACSAAAAPIKEELVHRRLAFEAALADRLARAKAEGDLPEQECPADLARFVMMIANGIAVQAASGAPADALKRAATLALRSWPRGATEATRH